MFCMMLLIEQATPISFLTHEGSLSHIVCAVHSQVERGGTLVVFDEVTPSSKTSKIVMHIFVCNVEKIGIAKVFCDSFSLNASRTSCIFE